MSARRESRSRPRCSQPAFINSSRLVERGIKSPKSLVLPLHYRVIIRALALIPCCFMLYISPALVAVRETYGQAHSTGRVAVSPEVPRRPWVGRLSPPP